MTGPEDFAPAPLKRGYRAPLSLRDDIAAAHRTRPWLTAGLALLDHARAMSMVLLAAWAVLAAPVPVAVVTVVAAATGVGRELRALECLVHEASHGNWIRRFRTVNDALGLVLAGLPTSARIGDYRSGHLLHHRRFGTADDPDRTRYVELGLEELRRESVSTYARDVLVRLPRYQVGWLRTTKSTPARTAIAMCWGVLGALPALPLLGWRGVVAAASTWLAGYLVALPTIRLIGESSEHVYTDGDTVFDTTVSNLGLWQRILLHPHNDGLHTVHHMWPGIPHHALPRVHALLVREDRHGYAARVRTRMRLLESPGHGLPDALRVKLG